MLLSTLLTFAVHTAFEAVSGEDRVVLLDKPCYVEVIPHILTDQRLWNAADAFLGGKRWKACWYVGPADNVVFVFSDGDFLIQPLAAFRERSI